MKKLRKTETCLNCDKEIGDSNYCPHCGQLNTNKHVKLKYFVEDFLGDYLTFDSKFFRSFVPLITKPGFLTNEYSRGKRVNYILPLRLYIFVVFIFFLMFSVKMSFSDSSVVSGTKNSRENIADLISDYSPEAVVDSDKLSAISKKYKVIERVQKEDINITGALGNSSIIRFFENKIIKLAESSQIEGGGQLLGKFFDQIPKTLFLLLPFFALVLKLIYIRRKILYVKHLVFALHTHTIIFLIAMLGVLFENLWVRLFFCFLGFVYIFMAFRKVYGQSVLKTLLKMTLVFWGYMMLFPFAATMITIMFLANM